ncbi:MAB_1171c family putative transporter [Streptomyces sp. NPDC045456]|uniref:MAB_1171c family putative transporter n=1 Tax=Streptomyces sp. NPDC045456 TaxID=3155254 RepID=UPI0033D299F5
MLIIGAFWKAIDLARAPHDRVLRLLVTSFLLLATGEVFSFPEVNGAVDALTTVGFGKIVFNASTMTGLSALILFFAASTRDAGDSYRRYVGINALILTGVIAAMTVLMICTPAAMRGHTLSTPHMAQPSIALFYIVGNVYLSYAYLTAGRWALRYVRLATWHLSLGLRTMAIGLCILAATSAGRIVWVSLRINEPGSHQAFNTVNWFITDLALGAVTVGMTYSASMQLVTHLRSVMRHRRMYRQLTPLWTVLSAAYPELVLERKSVGPGKNRAPLFRIHERFYRRLIECRDGLVRLSPYLTSVAPEADLARCPTDQLAQYIAAALALKPDREDPDAALSATPIAFPSGNDLAADASELVAVSRAYAKGNHDQGADHR